MNKPMTWLSGLLAATVFAAAGLPQPGAAARPSTTTAAATLSQSEADSLMFMREEEKLARDVYLWLYRLHGDKTFYNIAQSEERHTSQVKALLLAYGLPDPAATTAPGVFQNATLQALYNELIARGSGSPLIALHVGGLIEEKDIRDIQVALSAIDNPDIITVYRNLIDGSANHLRTFVTRIEAVEGAYQPQLLTENEFNAIVN